MPLLDRLDHSQRAHAVEGDLPFYSVYTAGIAGERFFRALKDEGKIMGTRCAPCDVMYVPGRLYCEQCFGHLDGASWFDAGTLGSVHTFTVLHIDLDGNALQAPRVLAFIEIGEMDGGLVHDLGGVDADAVYIGMAVKAVFRPLEERSGSITDILHFRPVE